jgi:hypothetical protein
LRKQNKSKIERGKREWFYFLEPINTAKEASKNPFPVYVLNMCI